VIATASTTMELDEPRSIFGEVVRHLTSGSPITKQVLLRCMHASALIGNMEGCEWFKREAYGYPLTAEVPSHRTAFGKRVWRARGMDNQLEYAVRAVNYGRDEEAEGAETATMSIRVDFDTLASVTSAQYVLTGETRERRSPISGRYHTQDRADRYEPFVFRAIVKEIERMTLEYAMAQYQALSRVPQTGSGTEVMTNRVFVVHGHDLGAKHEVARFLERLGLEGVILDERPNEGLTLIEKFEKHAATTTYAVVLVTPDDVGAVGSSPDALTARARQNVVFELGFFCGRLGRGRVCLLYKPPADIPSDLSGVAYVELDSKEGWKMKLLRELESARLPADRSKLN
jgi:predicted nucleotide-binding protein